MEIYKICGIYGIRNIINGKIYVGKTQQTFGDRWDEHRCKLRNNYHDNKHLQNAWNKYGEESFEFIILEVIDDKQNNELYNEREKYWIS